MPEEVQQTIALKRTLKLRDLLFYGIVLVTPIAPVPIYGVAQKLSGGRITSCILLAGIAMMLTALSYGRMAALYPSAGSAYAYVGKGLNHHLGFLAGWVMTLDYLALPIVAVIQAALAIHRLAPFVPYAAWVAMFSLIITGLNLRGLRSTARANTVLLSAMFVVIGAFLILAFRYLFHYHGIYFLSSPAPSYRPPGSALAAIATATSFAALTFIGFDGITTLAEDVEKPRRNILLATVSVCALTTALSWLLVFLAQSIWPDYRTFPNIETAFMDVTRRVGGDTLFQGMGGVVILSSLGGALTGQVAVARILYGMGRDGVLPRRFFSYVHPRTNVPTANIVFVAVIILIGSLVLGLEHAGELVNFGAFLAFMGVNLATVRQYYFLRSRTERRLTWDFLLPTLGFAFCLGIWLSLPMVTKLAGGGWLLLGAGYAVYRTHSRAYS